MPDRINLSSYKPREDELEKASNGYLMSVMALMMGTPVPIINLLASVFFYLGNRKSTFYVRWHCTQAMLSQLTMLIINSIGFSWSMKIIFGSEHLSDPYLSYMATMITFNIIELAVNISAAVRVRKGKHVEWWFWGALTNVLLKPEQQSRS
jgi:hypothetical protein